MGTLFSTQRNLVDDKEGNGGDRDQDQKKDKGLSDRLQSGIQIVASHSRLPCRRSDSYPT
jgi:hypothetical protein